MKTSSAKFPVKLQLITKKFRSPESMNRIPYETAHLSHRGKDVRNMNINERLFNEYTKMNQFDLTSRIKSLGVGKTSSPTLL